MQISIFDGTKPFKIIKPIRLITLFSGYDSQALSLKYLGIPFEHYHTCEWAMPSIQALKDLHFDNDNSDYSVYLSKAELVDILYARGVSSDYNKALTKEQLSRYPETKLRTIYNNIIATKNLVSICNINGKDLEICDTDKYEYIMTYSFPCQDLSLAGKGAGMEKGSGTRSGLLWEVERLLEETKELPQVLLMENVPEVIGSKNIKHFAKWVEFLDNLGYRSKWGLLNAKDFGISEATNYPNNVLSYSNGNNKNVHPTQKPVALLEYLIKTYTNENELVLDNCMGSGSTGVACVNTNRNFIGIELDENYFNIAKERIYEQRKSERD